MPCFLISLEKSATGYKYSSVVVIYLPILNLANVSFGKILTAFHHKLTNTCKTTSNELSPPHSGQLFFFGEIIWYDHVISNVDELKKTKKDVISP